MVPRWSKDVSHWKNDLVRFTLWFQPNGAKDDDKGTWLYSSLKCNLTYSLKDVIVEVIFNKLSLVTGGRKCYRVWHDRGQKNYYLSHGERFVFKIIIYPSAFRKVSKDRPGVSTFFTIIFFRDQVRNILKNL